MKRIWKYEVPYTDTFPVEMPKGAEILCVQMRRNVPQIWALVDPKTPLSTRIFRLAGTDHSIKADLDLNYIGSFQTAEETLIFHLFEILYE